MLNELKRLLIKEYGDDDPDFYEGIPAMIGKNKDWVADIIDFIKTEAPTKEEVILHSVYLHRGYTFDD